MSAPVAPRGFSEATLRELSERRGEPQWVHDRRMEAWHAYSELPMPARTDEEWRRTDISRLRLDTLTPYASEATTGMTTQAPSLAPEGENVRAYAGFVGLRNGRATEVMLDKQWAEKGVIFCDFATAARDHEALLKKYLMTQAVKPGDSKFAALHGAFWENGIFLYVPRGVQVTAPLRAVSTADVGGNASLISTLIVMEPGSEATFAQDFLSEEGTDQGTATTLSLSSRVVELILKQDAILHYAGVQRLGRTVYDFHTERAILGQDSALTLQTIELGSRLSKGRVESVLQGSGASAKLLGLWIEDKHQHLDRYTLQEHQAPNGTSDLLFKGVLADQARSVFSGLIRVTPEARGTAAYQQNRNLLLSRQARADSIPNLEIAANDIQGCSHGATVGKVDPEQLFYLMTRGMDRVDATRLIVQGFVDPVLEAIPIPELRDALRAEVQGRVSMVQPD